MEDVYYNGGKADNNAGRKKSKNMENRGSDKRIAIIFSITSNNKLTI